VSNHSRVLLKFVKVNFYCTKLHYYALHQKQPFNNQDNMENLNFYTPQQLMEMYPELEKTGMSESIIEICFDGSLIRGYVLVGDIIYIDHSSFLAMVKWRNIVLEKRKSMLN